MDQPAVECLLMGNEKYAAGKVKKGCFQGGFCLDIQVVCRFIQDEKIAGSEGEQSHFDLGLFPATQCPDSLGGMFAGDAAEG